MSSGDRPAGAAPRPPIEGADVRRAAEDDAAELLVLQRCCWVDEAIANETLDIAALHESLDDVRRWIDEWTTWCVRLDGRLVAAVRARREGGTWEIGRLMVAPDLSGHGLGRWLLGLAEADAPDDVDVIALFTGAKSARNIAMYERAGFRRTGAHVVLLWHVAGGAGQRAQGRRLPAEGEADLRHHRLRGVSPAQGRHRRHGDLLSRNIATKGCVIAGLVPAIPFRRARPCHMIGIARTSPAMTLRTRGREAPSSSPGIAVRRTACFMPMSR